MIGIIVSYDKNWNILVLSLLTLITIAWLHERIYLLLGNTY